MNKNTHILYVSMALALMTFAFGFNAYAGTPSVTSTSATDVTSNGATLNCSYNSNGSPTSVKFQIGTSSSLGGARIYFPNQNCTVAISSLSPGTTYYFRVIAQSSEGTTFGTINSFTTSNSSGGGGSSTGGSGTGDVNNGNYSNYSGSNTSGPTAPSAVTNGPVSVSANSAVINGSINPNNAEAKFWFEFGVTNSFGKTTTVQPTGSGNLWQLVTGTLSGLESGRTYFYRVVAQNNFGTAIGDTMSFKTSGSSSQSNGQVLGSTSTGGSSTTNRQTTSASSRQINARPSFISLEYSLADNNALVLVANDVKPAPGDEFSYDVVYKNNTEYAFNESYLRVIIPSEAFYISSNVQPIKVSSNIAEFDLGTIQSHSQGSVIVTVGIRETTVPGANMIFTSVLTYKDRLGTQLTTTSYMTVRAGEAGAASSTSASLFSSLIGSSGMLWFIAFGLVILLGTLIYGLIRMKRKNGDNQKDEFGLDKIPATFEPIGSARPLEASLRK